MKPREKEVVSDFWGNKRSLDLEALGGGGLARSHKWVSSAPPHPQFAYVRRTIFLKKVYTGDPVDVGIDSNIKRQTCLRAFPTNKLGFFYLLTSYNFLKKILTAFYTTPREGAFTRNVIFLLIVCLAAMTFI